MKKIIAVEWRKTVGIVAVEGENGLWRAYIGVAKGYLEPLDKLRLRLKFDAQHIADYGAKLSKTEAVAFFPLLDADKFDEEKR